MYYNEHDITKVYDLADTNGITPLVYYLPGTKFVFEANFDNADQIDELYITSTRNNETKYLKATCEEYGYSARVIHKILRMARTSADLNNENNIRYEDILNVLSYRDLDQSNSPLMVVK